MGILGGWGEGPAGRGLMPTPLFTCAVLLWGLFYAKGLGELAATGTSDGLRLTGTV